MTLRKNIILAAAGAGIALMAMAPASFAADFYAGKTITVLVGLTPGSGPDISARFNAKHIGNHIPGKPKFVVKNLPGAQFQKAQGFVFNRAKKDGLTFYAGPWSWISQVIGLKTLRVRYHEFTYIGSAQNPGRIMYMRNDAVDGGFKGPGDLMKIKNLKFGGSGPTVGFDVVARLTFEMLGLKYNYVPGYRGSNRTRQAITRGELNVGIDAPISWNFRIVPTMLKTGVVSALWAFPVEGPGNKLIRDPNFPELPYFINEYKKITGKEPSGKEWDAIVLSLGYARMGHTWFGAPGMPAEATKIMRKAFADALNSPAYQAESAKLFKYASKHMPIDVGLQKMAQIAKFEPKMIAFLKDFIARGEAARGPGKRRRK